MTIGEAALLVVPGLVVSVTGIAVTFRMNAQRDADRSRGERIGALEDWRKFEEGRRAGYAEALAERSKDGK